MTNKKQQKAMSLKDMKEGESVIGYIKGFFKAPKSLTPNSENVNLVTKTGEEITFWASGDVVYLRERMKDNNVSEGVLVKITRTPKRENAKNPRQQYFADIKFNPKDTVDPSTIGTNYTGGGSIADF